MTVLERLQQLLDAHGIDYGLLRHEPVYTSADAARVRGTSLASGAKALVCKADDALLLFVIPADRKLASAGFRKARRVKSFRFADRDEVERATGLAPGAIPPFGSLFGLPTFCDERLAEAGAINFNAGDHAVSITLEFDDYLAVERPQLGRFAE